MDRIKKYSIFLTVCLFAVSVWSAHGAGGSRIVDGILSRYWHNLPLPPGDTESDRIDRFLEENRRLLGLHDNPAVELVRARHLQTGIGERFVYRQQAYSLPVFNAQLILAVKDNQLISLFNALSSSQFEAASPAFSSVQALIQAENIIEGTLYRAEPEIEIGYSPDGILIYRLRLPGLDPPADWEIWMDALTGEIIRHTDRRIFENGAGQVFDPDPKTALEDNTLLDLGDSNAAIPIEAYSDVILYDLDPPVGGYYYLDGPFVSTALTSNRATELTPDFFYLREDDRFEEVMVYYHLDHTQRYFQDQLQVFNANNRQQPCNVNGTTDDNSWYSPMTGSITYGSGGVDDAEDADVIIHEYGHAVQDNINPFWGGGHTGAMGEGFGDYIAGSYSLTVNSNFQPDWVFNWDGHNEFWNGRILNADYHYPENAGGEIHDSGQLWSAGLIDVWWDIPDVIAWDRIIIEHHFLLGYGALMEDAAEAILVTEAELYNGIYRQIIVDNFAARGFIDPVTYYPLIAHDPLPDSEDTLQTEFEVIAEITSAQPLEESSLQLFWRADEDPYAAVLITPTGSPDEYSGIIPGPFNDQIVSYYLTAADTLNMAAFLPEGAPAECFQFYVGPDSIPPVIAWTDSLGETVFPTASFPVNAVVTDNIGIGSVELRWRVGGGDWQSSIMTLVEADTFGGTLSYQDELLDQTVEYLVRAVDSSSRQNSADGVSQFFSLDSDADLDDFEGALADWEFNGDWGLTNQFAHNGSWAIEDSPDEQYPSNSNTWAQWGQTWDMSAFDGASLFFWEMHILEQMSDWGYFEVSVDNAPWESLLSITGSDNSWHLREIVLDEFCGEPAREIRFRFRTLTDDSGSLFGWFIDDISITVEIIVPVDNKNETSPYPGAFSLGPVYPNPFNPETTISFEVPSPEDVSIRIYNAQGQLVGVVVDEFYPAGIHEAPFDGDNLASGLYFCRMQAGSFQQIQKLLLLK